MAQVAVAGIFIFIVAGGVSLGVASADSTDELARAGAFGFTQETHEATQVYGRAASAAAFSDDAAVEKNVLATASERDITAGLAMVDERMEAERAEVEADNIAVIGRVAREKAMQGVGVEPAQDADSGQDGAQPDTHGAASASTLAAYDLPEIDGAVDEYHLTPVDWSVGKYDFLSEWTARIDAYLEGTALEGYGYTFAAAAWRHGIDPRWSPAISNTESGNGAHCFLPHNAWGWGDDSWPDWETAIAEHVAGLAKGYGYSVTPACAQKYCPPNYVHWYNNTLAQMALI